VVSGVPDGPLRKLAQLWSGDAGETLAGLPGDAWGAFAIPQLGEAAESLFATFAGTIGSAAVAAQVKQATGLELQQDVFSWVGDVGGFVRGSDKASLGGALVIGSIDDRRAEAAFPRIVGLIGKQTGVAPRPVEIDGADSAFTIAAAHAEQPLVLARGEGRVVAAYGREAASAALAPEAKLGDSDSFAAARELLGDDLEPAFLLSMTDFVRFSEPVGETDTELHRAGRYLEALGVITSGAKAEEDRVQSRVAVTLK
jgi:hypothetical protein